MTGDPWIARWRGQRWGSAASRTAAMNVVDRPYRLGWCQVEHPGTGELWERRRGSWRQVQGPQGRLPAAATP